jgi:hypothetical protein
MVPSAAAELHQTRWTKSKSVFDSALQHLHSDGLKLSLEKVVVGPRTYQHRPLHQTNLSRDGCDCRKVRINVDLVVSVISKDGVSSSNFVAAKESLLTAYHNRTSQISA